MAKKKDNSEKHPLGPEPTVTILPKWKFRHFNNVRDSMGSKDRIRPRKTK